MSKEDIEGNTLIGIYLGAEFINDAPDEYPNGYYINGSFDDILPEHWEFNCLMDWLYPVYQKITTFMDSEEYFSNQNHLCKKYMYKEFYNIQHILMSGKEVSELFKGIVAWIKVYNNLNKELCIY